VVQKGGSKARRGPIETLPADLRGLLTIEPAGLGGWVEPKPSGPPAGKRKRTDVEAK